MPCLATLHLISSEYVLLCGVVFMVEFVVSLADRVTVASPGSRCEG